MIVLLMIFAGLLGLAVGSFANVVAYRLPAGVSLLRPSRCPGCDKPIREWQNIPVVSWLALRGRCASCGWRIPSRYALVEAITGATFAALAWFVPVVLGVSGAAGVFVWIAFSWFAAASAVLVLIDRDTKTLPDVIVLPSYLVALILLTISCVFGADWWALLRALIGMAAMYAVYWLIRAIRPDGMGGGDVKLAGLAGLYLGWLGWGSLGVGWLAAFVLGGGVGIALLLRGKADRSSAIAFGPWLVAGAWLGIWFGQWIGQLYSGLIGLA